MRKVAIVIATAMIGSLGVWATAQAQTPINQTNIGSTGISSTVDMNDQSYMQAWSITADELSRYKALMKGPRGSLSVTNISPLEVLGIHAKTPAERDRYAERFVEMMREDTEQVLAFERAVQNAWARSGAAMFDFTRLPSRVRMSSQTQNSALKGLRLAIFVAEKDCDACQYELKRLAAMARPGQTLSGLDVYVVDTDSDDIIRQIAHSAGIVKEDVSSRRITINRGRALFSTLPDGAPLPAVFYRSGKTLRPLSQLAGAR